jgi:hypothetical protein
MLNFSFSLFFVLGEKGFRSLVMNDVLPAIWPHALAKVSDYPSLLLHLRQIREFSSTSKSLSERLCEYVNAC